MEQINQGEMEMTNKKRSDTGKRIKALRVNSGLTWREFAKSVKLSTQTLHHYESGQNYPATASLLSISKFCNVSIDWILTGREFVCRLRTGNKRLARSAALKNLDEIPLYFIRWFGWSIEKTTKKVTTPTLLKMEYHFKGALTLLRKELKNAPRNRL